jgi:hypothetical protein
VTKITPNAIAWAAIIRSKPPGNCPCLSSSVRSRPYSRAAAESQATLVTAVASFFGLLPEDGTGSTATGFLFAYAGIFA